jgi:hypothetical protein
MTRYVCLALVLWSGTTAAFDSTRWVQVTGGAWERSTAVLSELEAALKPVVTSASQNRGRIPHSGRATVMVTSAPGSTPRLAARPEPCTEVLEVIETMQ